jgi:hypothetical protein
MLREVSLRGALTRLAAFTYLALGLSRFLVNLYWPHFNIFRRHPVWVATTFALWLFAPLLILFARSATTRRVGAWLLFIAVIAWLFEPDGGLQ